MNVVIRRLLLGFAFVAFVLVVGAGAIYGLGGGRWTLGEAFFMAAISASTVGYGELPGFEQVPYARLTAVVIIVLGIAAFTYFQSMLTAFLVEGSLRQVFRRRWMMRRIEQLDGHFVIAGCGSTGLHVVEELVATRRPFVVIDRDRDCIDKLVAEYGEARVLYVQGDATSDTVLVEAGVSRAAGVVAALTHDPDNLYVTLSARALNGTARIVTKVVEPAAAPKMVRAGANATVSPNTIGGRRLAAELVRPTVVQFLDIMLRDKDRNLRFEEVTIPEDSHVAGKRLCDVALRQETGTLVVGFRGTDRSLQYNPPATLVLEPGSVLVVLAEVADMERLRNFLNRPS